MMKVLLINDFEFDGGAETVFRETYTLLKEAGIEADKFVASQKHTFAKGPLEYIFSTEAMKILRDKLDAFQPDVVHLHCYYHVLSPGILVALRKYKKKRRVKVIYTAHDYHLIYPHAALVRYNRGKMRIVQNTSLMNILLDRVDSRTILHSWLKKIQWLLAYRILGLQRVFDTMISPSEFLMKILTSKGFSNIVVVRNPVQIPAQYAKANHSQIDQSVRLVFFGRLSKEKGVDLFLEKLAKCQRRFEFDIYGDGPEAAGLRDLTERLSLSQVVFFKGFMPREEVLDRLHLYNAMVLPSVWYENAPMSIVEAASLNLVIVGSDLGGIKELAELCGKSVLFDPFGDRISIDQLIDRIAVEAKKERIFSFEAFSSKTYLDGLTKFYTA